MLKELHKNIKFSKSFCPNLYFRVRGQKAYCDGHKDKVDYTIACAFMLLTIIYHLQDYGHNN